MPEFKPLRLVRQKLKKQGLPVYAGETHEHIYGSSALKLLSSYEQRNWAGGGVLPRNMGVLGAELILITHDRPYFKIYPEFVGPLSDTGLDVPVEYCKLPYTSFEIRLPLEQQIHFTLGGSYSATGESIRMNVYSLMVYTEAAAIDAIVAAMRDFSDEHRRDVRHLVDVAADLRDVQKRSLSKKGCDGVIAIAMHGMAVDPSRQLMTESGIKMGSDDSPIAAVFPLIKGMTVEESLAHASSDEVIEAASEVLRLALAVSFLATGHDRLIEPDVLSKHLAKFSSPDATEETIEKLHAQATKKRGEGKGYTIGRRERLLRVAQARNEGLNEEEARHLKHQHQRRGHIHRFHKSGKLIYKWIPQLTVRPDLPVDKRGSAGIVLK